MGFRPRYGRLSSRLTSRRIRHAVRHITGFTVLDAGCNIAELARFLPANVDYVGLEIMPQVVELNRRRYPERVFVQGDLEAPWPAVVTRRQFDHVVLLAVLEHLHDPAAVLERARAVLAPGGSIVMTTPHPRARLFHELGARLRLFSRDASEEHAALYDRQELVWLAKDAGLEIEHYILFQLGLNQLAVLQPSEPAVDSRS